MLIHSMYTTGKNILHGFTTFLRCPEDSGVIVIAKFY